MAKKVKERKFRDAYYDNELVYAWLVRVIEQEALTSLSGGVCHLLKT